MMPTFAIRAAFVGSQDQGQQRDIPSQVDPTTGAPNSTAEISFPEGLLIGVFFGIVTLGLILVLLGKRYRQRQEAEIQALEGSEFVPIGYMRHRSPSLGSVFTAGGGRAPPPPYSPPSPPPPAFEFACASAPPVALVANHAQATSHHGAYHADVSDRDEEQIELLELPRTTRREGGLS